MDSLIFFNCFSHNLHFVGGSSVVVSLLSVSNVERVILIKKKEKKNLIFYLLKSLSRSLFK